MIRLDDWPERLADLIRAAERPFIWGKHDCVTFAGDAIVATTGVDPFPEIRGSYDDEAGARVAIRRLASGGRLYDAGRAIAKRLDVSKVDPAFAQRGDIAYVAGPMRGCLGVVFSGRVFVIGPDGVNAGPLSAARTVWHI